MKQLIPIALASVLAIACSDDGNLSSANDVERVYHVHDTTYIDTFTITDTLVLTSVDTLVINNTDTSIITHTDTNYITKVDTQYITQHDTIYVEDDEDEVVVVHDTIVKTEYETKYITTDGSVSNTGITFKYKVRPFFFSSNLGFNDTTQVIWLSCTNSLDVVINEVNAMQNSFRFCASANCPLNKETDTFYYFDYTGMKVNVDSDYENGNAEKCLSGEWSCPRKLSYTPSGSTKSRSVGFYYYFGDTYAYVDSFAYFTYCED